MESCCLCTRLLYSISVTNDFFVIMESDLINSELAASLKTHELVIDLTSSCKSGTAQPQPVLENQYYWLNYLLLFVSHKG